jgi:hypothetical protein
MFGFPYSTADAIRHNVLAGHSVDLSKVVNKNNDAQAVVVVRNPTNKALSLQANKVALYRAEPEYEQVGPRWSATRAP